MPQQSRNWVVSYISAALIWGASFLFIAVSATALPAFGVAFIRLFIGTVTLFVIIKVKGYKIPTDLDTWKKFLVGGAFMSAIPFTLFAYAETHVTSALAGIVNSTTPVATVLAILIAFRSEKITRAQWFGLGIGILGSAVLIGAWQGFGENDPLAIIALFVATICYGFGGPYVRRYIEPKKLPNEVGAFGQVAGGAIMVLPFYLFAAPEKVVGTIDIWVILSMLALGIFGSAIAYVSYYNVLKSAGSAIASSVTLATPVVAVALGVIIRHESISWYEPVGGAVIIFGAAVAQGRFKKLFRS
jgi:drug/metabolite transporter (DMT)-like permease